MTGSAFLESQHLGPGQTRAAIDLADDVGRGRGWREKHIARQLMQIDVAQFPEFVLDNATFLLTHCRRAAVQLIASQHPADRDGRGYRVALLAEDGMDLVAVHPPLAMGDDLRLDPFRLTSFPPFGPAPARQQVSLLTALQIAIVILAERLRAGPVVSVEVADPLEQRRPAGLHRLIFRDQKPPLLQVVAFNRPVVAVVAHRIVLRCSDPISELVNMHSNDGMPWEAAMRNLIMTMLAGSMLLFAGHVSAADNQTTIAVFTKNRTNPAY